MLQFGSYPIFVNYSTLEDALVENGYRGLTNGAAEWVPGNSAAASVYEQAVSGLLSEITRRAVGRLVLSFLPPTFPVLITQYDANEVKRHGTCNAVTEPFKIPSPNFFLRLGYVRVSFSPNGDCADGSSPGTAMDETLLHELVHAYRIATGTDAAVKLVGPIGRYYENTEEFLSILVTNMYISETSRRLRYHHKSHALLPSELATSAGFLKDESLRKVIRMLANADPHLMHRLSLLTPPRFNPLKEFYSNRWWSMGLPEDHTAD